MDQYIGKMLDDRYEILELIGTGGMANVYRGTTGISLLSGMAALGLFLALLGSRVMLAAVKGGYELVTNGVEHQGAFRARDKDLLRALARDLEQKDGAEDARRHGKVERILQPDDHHNDAENQTKLRNFHCFSSSRSLL